MKTNIIYKVVVVIATLVFSVSCTNQEQEAMDGGNNFTANIEQGLTRTTLIDNYYVGWYYGDKIMINGATYAASPKGKVATSADLIYVVGNIPAAPYKAIYPASLDNAGTGTYAFPETQEYQEGRFNAPMYAESNTKSLQFRNICGVLCFSLKGSEAIRDIEISTSGGQYLWGPFTIDESGKAITNTDGGQHFVPKQAKGEEVSMNNQYGTVRLDCGEEGVQLYENIARNFYVYLPAANYHAEDLTVTIHSITGEEYTRTNTTNAVVDVNSIYTFNWEVFKDEEPIDVVTEDPNSLTIVVSNPILHETFTIDSEGTKVRFTHGNLYWSDKGWALETHQYDCPTSGLYDASHVNLFFWSTNAGASIGKEAQTMLIMTGTTPKLFCDGSDADHCFYAKSSSDDESGTPLHALTYEQWEYLLKGRISTDVYSYAAAKVNDIAGLLIFPDNFSENGKKLVDDLITKNAVTGLNDNNVAEPTANIPTNNWDNLEKEGVVFLPAAGYREGDKVNNGNGRYWTSTYDNNNNNNNPLCLTFTNSAWERTLAHHYYGSAIRLVYQLPALTPSYK